MISSGNEEVASLLSAGRRVFCGHPILILIVAGAEAGLARQVMVLCELDGPSDWRPRRFLSVNGILTPKRCCFVVFIRVHALFLVVEQTAIKI